MDKNTYIDEFEKKGLKPLEEYVDSKTQILTECLLCGKQFLLTPRAVRIKTGYGCRGCNQRDDDNSFREKMKSVNPNIKILGKYIDSKTKIKCKCKIDGFEWEQRPNDLINGIGCFKCNNHMTITDKQFKNEFYKLNNDIILKSEYKNYRTPILCQCKHDGYEWYAYGYDLLNGKAGCRKCNGRYIPTTQEFIDEMYEINPQIEIIGEYIDSKTPIECRCKNCNTTFYPSPSNIKNSKTGCPECNGNKSKMEKFLVDIFDRYKINYEKQKKYDGLTGIGGRRLSYDFYLPSYNLLIECQGLQHEKPIEYFGGEEKFEIQQEHDKRKKEYALNNNIGILEIWYNQKLHIEEIIIKALGLELSA